MGSLFGTIHLNNGDTISMMYYLFITTLNIINIILSVRQAQKISKTNEIISKITLPGFDEMIKEQQDGTLEILELTQEEYEKLEQDEVLGLEEIKNRLEIEKRNRDSKVNNKNKNDSNGDNSHNGVDANLIKTINESVINSIKEAKELEKSTLIKNRIFIGIFTFTTAISTLSLAYYIAMII